MERIEAVAKKTKARRGEAEKVRRTGAGDEARGLGGELVGLAPGQVCGEWVRLCNCKQRRNRLDRTR